MSNVRGKSLKAMARDIAEGYVTVNPLFLKSFDNETLKEFYHEVMKTQGEVRGEKFPHNDVMEIRLRNLRLQRLHSSAMIIRNFARARRIPLI
ncbi:MAG TPA: hypothetical protein VEI96_06025 [Thermodesulfovibrionales bacterium]|nr:hypothetical protein [Thermodesulfovibrionales bacterium]